MVWPGAWPVPAGCSPPTSAGADDPSTIPIGTTINRPPTSATCGTCWRLWVLKAYSSSARRWAVSSPWPWARRHRRPCGALLNDVGPDVAAEGLAPIIAYVEQDKTFADWSEVIGHLQAFFPNLPAASESEWMAIAKASYVVRDDGRIVQDWDPNIVKPLRGVDTAEIDLWPYFRSLARFPLVGVRGEKSDVLTADTFQSMSEAVPSMAAVTVCGVGHAPTLAEPEVVEALERALEKADESQH